MKFKLQLLSLTIGEWSFHLINIGTTELPYTKTSVRGSVVSTDRRKPRVIGFRNKDMEAKP
jgi:hypothetical protein